MRILSTKKLNLFFVAALVVLFGVFLSLNTAVFAQAPETINYQGKLLDNTSAPVSDGSYSITFNLYNTASGGSTLWTETGAISVQSGLFSVQLGATTSLSTVDFNQQLYLGINVESDGEMTPRKPLSSVPSAFEAQNSQTFDNLATTSFLRSDQADTATGLISFTNGFLSVSSSTITDLTTTFATTSNFIINNELFTDLTGSGLENTTSGVLTANISESNLNITGSPTDGYILQASSTAVGGFVWQATSSLGFSGQSLTVGSDNQIPFSNSAGNDFDYSSNFTFNGSLFTLGGTGLSLSGTTANIALGSNWLSGDGADEGMFVDGSGNVGIGTSSPASKLDVWGDISTKGSLLASVAPSGNTYFLAGATSSSVTSGALGNIAIGGNSLTYLTLADDNIALGRNALRGSTTASMGGNHNIALGLSALTANYSGERNIGLGAYTLSQNTTGSDNIGIGDRALQSNKTGSNNIGFGASVLSLGSSGDHNIAMGYWAMRNNSGGSHNVALGQEALNSNGAGTYNTALGYQALRNNSGIGTVALGYRTADNLSSGDRGIFIGYDIDAPSTTADDQLNIGNLIFGTSVDGTGTTLSSGNIGIGTSSPIRKFTVDGGALITGALYDSSNNAGSNGYILQTTGAGTQWVATSSLGLSSPFGADINVTELASEDFGDFTCNGTTCSFDTNTVADNEIDYTQVTLSDFTDDVGYLSDITGELFYDLSDTPASYSANRILYQGGGGVTDNTDFVFDGSSLGVGTSSPASKLDVWGNLRVGTSSTPTLLVDSSTGNIGIGTAAPNATISTLGSLSTLTPIFFNRGALGTGLYASLDSNEYGWSATDKDFFIETEAGRPILFRTNSAEQMRLDSAGDLGIGEADPITRLHITDSVLPDVRLNNSDTSINLGDRLGKLEFYNNDSTATAGVSAYLDAYAEENFTGSGQAAALRFFTSDVAGDIGGVERLRITGAGSVGIGSSTPSSKLSVTGDIYGDGALRATGAIQFDALTNGLLLTDGTGVVTASSSIGGSLITADSLNFTELADALTLDASTDISVTGTNALSITNTGTGNSFLVNDAGSDSTPFVIDNAGNVGIGVTSPLVTLHVANANPRFRLDDINGDIFDMRSQNGVFEITNYTSGTHIPLAIDAQTPTDTMRLTTTGVGIGTSSPSSKLDVWGNFQVGTSSTPTLFADSASDRVRIATDQEGGKLSVGGTIASYGGSITNYESEAVQTEYIRMFQWDGDSYIDTPSANRIIFQPGSASNMLMLGAAGQDSVWNENGLAVTFRFEGDTDPYLLFVDGGTDRIGIGDNTPEAMLSVRTNGSDDIMHLQNNSGSTILSVLNNGNMGVGTTTPTALISTDYNDGTPLSTDLTLMRADSYQSFNGAYDLYGMYSKPVTHDGGIFTAAANNYAFYGAPSGGMTDWGIYLTGEDKNYFSGNVGIGTSSPASKLDVWGSFQVVGSTTAGFASISVDESSGRVAIGTTTPYSLLTLETSAGNVGLTFSHQNANAANIFFNTPAETDYARIQTVYNADSSYARFLFDGGSSEVMRIRDDFTVGIGTNNPQTALHIASTTANGMNLLRLQDSNSTCNFNADSGTPSCGSDRTLKKDIAHIENELATILALEPSFWRWKTEDNNAALHSGFIAQEVAGVLPELVTESTWIDGSKKKFLNIGGMMPYVVGAIKELWAIVSDNTDRIATLEQENTALLNRIKNLEQGNQSTSSGSSPGGGTDTTDDTISPTADDTDDTTDTTASSSDATNATGTSTPKTSTSSTTDTTNSTTTPEETVVIDTPMEEEPAPENTSPEGSLEEPAPEVTEEEVIAEDTTETEESAQATETEEVQE